MAAKAPKPLHGRAGTSARAVACSIERCVATSQTHPSWQSVCLPGSDEEVSSPSSASAEKDVPSSGSKPAVAGCDAMCRLAKHNSRRRASALITDPYFPGE